jgi:hypothetical protein
MLAHMALLEIPILSPHATRDFKRKSVHLRLVTRLCKALSWRKVIP